MTVMPLKHVAHANCLSLSQGADPESRFLYCDVSSVERGSLILPESEIALACAPSRARRVAKESDVVMSTVRPYLKAVAQVPGCISKLVFSTGFAVLTPQQDTVRSRYLYWALQSDPFVAEASRWSNGVSYPAINIDDLMQIKLTVPALETQERLACHLDVETTKIDRLITKQLELLQITKERAETDTEATIWGQFANSFDNIGTSKRSYQPRTVSCLALARRLSDIPKSWDIQRFKRVFSRTDDRNADLTLEMLSLRQTGAVVPRSQTGQNQEPSEDSLPKYLAVRPGDLVVNPMWLTGGAIGVSERSGAVSPDYRVFAVGKQLTPAYAHEILRSISYRRQSKLFERANTTYDRRIQQIDLDNLPIPIPPMLHQEQIVRIVSETHGRTRELTRAIERHIALLQERRSALITAVVTGQIEV